MKRILVAVLAATTSLAAVSTHADARDSRKQTLTSAVEDGIANTATLPIHQGVDAGGQPFWCVVTDSSSQRDARSRGVNYSPKLANARRTSGVQTGSIINGVLHVAATVDFSPTRLVVPDPTIGFPPLAASPGAVGEDGYTPLVALSSRSGNLDGARVIAGGSVRIGRRYVGGLGVAGLVSGADLDCVLAGLCIPVEYPIAARRHR